MRRRAVPTRSRSGFTILELLIALLALTAVATVAIPMYFERAEITLENAAIQLAEDVRMAQNRAAYLGRNATVRFEEDGYGYQIVEDVPGGPEITHERHYDADAVFEGVRISSVRFGASNRELRFGPRGSAVAGGEVVIGFHGETRVLRVMTDSGRIQIVGSSSNWRDDGI